MRGRGKLTRGAVPQEVRLPDTLRDEKALPAEPTMSFLVVIEAELPTENFMLK